MTPNARGTIIPPLDPSARGVRKRDMLDWLQTFHLFTVVESNKTTGEVANVVRRLQPERTSQSLTLVSSCVRIIS